MMLKIKNNQPYVQQYYNISVMFNCCKVIYLSKAIYYIGAILMVLKYNFFMLKKSYLPNGLESLN